jgi:zinc transporter ZupT
MFGIVNAQTQSNVTAFATVINPIITNVVNPLVEFAFAIALVVFVYGVVQMVIHSTDAEAHKNGKASMLSGIIGMTIMFSAWGIIYIISNTVKSFN